MKRALIRLAAAACLAGALGLGGACGGDEKNPNTTGGDDGELFALTSSAFEAGEAIPQKHSCEGADVSPPLAWTDASDGTVRFALTIRDPDGGDAQHWGLIDIPGDVESLAEGISPAGDLPADAWETLNYKGEVGYAGPCPPPPHDAHGYVFTLYALGEPISEPDEDATLDSIEPALESAALATTTLVGQFDR